MHRARMKHTIVQNTRNISIGKMISISTHESTEIKALNFSRPVNVLMMVVEALQKNTEQVKKMDNWVWVQYLRCSNRREAAGWGV